MADLGAYLERVARRPWNHGDKAGAKQDCCTFGADWCVFAGYPDPMAFIREAYASEEEALALVRKSGLVKLATRGFESIGLKRTKAPRTGDVAVIRRPTEDGDNIVCAIRSGERWITLMERGIVVDEGGTLLRAWRVAWARQ